MAKAQAVAEDPFAVLRLSTHSHRAGGRQVSPEFLENMEAAFADANDKTRRIFHRIKAEAQALHADFEPIDSAFWRSDSQMRNALHQEHVEHFSEQVQIYGTLGKEIARRSIELLKRTEWLYLCYLRGRG